MNKKLKLTIELIPSSVWSQNLRSILKPKVWAGLRKEVCRKYNYRCVICGSKGKLQAHEVWEYDDKDHIQRLKDVIAVCSKCHLVKHIGFAGILGTKKKIDYENLVKHFMKVNKCSHETFEKHLKEAIKKFEELSRYDWQIDLLSLKRKLTS